MENLLRRGARPDTESRLRRRLWPLPAVAGAQAVEEAPAVVRQQPYSAALTRTLAIASSTEGRSIANTVSGVTTAYSM
jgi:hypothetical protein